MRILVIGASGQVGVALMSAQRKAGSELIGLSRPEVDLTRADTIDAALARYLPTVVINAAAFTAVDKAERDREAAFSVNGKGPELLAIACRRHSAPLIHLSTDYVFDGTAARPYRETDAIGPINLYGLSKASGEAAVRAHQPRHVIVRTAWVYSAQGHNFVTTILRLAAAGKGVRVVADQRGAPTASADVAGAVMTIARRAAALPASGDAAWGTYHFTCSGETTWHGFAEYVFDCQQEILGWRPSLQAISTAEYPTAARRPQNSCLDCSRIARVFGIIAPPWQHGVAAIVRAIVAPERRGSVPAAGTS